MSLLPAETAWYVTGRFYKAADQTLADFGYFLYLAGIEGALFSGAPGADTAHFTFAAEPFLATPVSNGALALSLDPVGAFSIFLQRTPAGDFDQPQSFASGDRIATFRRSSVVMGTAVAAGPGLQNQALLSNNVFSARLIDSTPFDFAGRRYDLRTLLGAGVTQFGTAAAVPVSPTPPGFVLAVPFSGSAIALGRAEPQLG